MTFWGTLISRKIHYVHCAHSHTRRLRITQASLGLESTDKVFKDKKVVVICSQGKTNRFTLCVLIPKKVESQSLALELDIKDDVEISVVGSHKVSLCGYFLNDDRHFVVNNDNSDTEGEDVQDSDDDDDDDDDDDYDYEDDFIVDDRDFKGSLKRRGTKKQSCDDEEIKSYKKKKTINSPVKPSAKPKAGWCKQLTPKFDL